MFPREIMRGPAGVAVQLYAARVDTVEEQAMVACWFLNCPGQSAPGVEQYILWANHLRPLPGLGPPAPLMPGATHEVLLAALDPDGHPEPTDSATWEPFVPANLVQQLILTDDVACQVLIRSAAEEICGGRLWANPSRIGEVEPWRSWLYHAAVMT